MFDTVPSPSEFFLEVLIGVHLSMLASDELKLSNLKLDDEVVKPA
jgi:hypothetical protein